MQFVGGKQLSHRNKLTCTKSPIWKLFANPISAAWKVVYDVFMTPQYCCWELPVTWIGYCFVFCIFIFIYPPFIPLSFHLQMQNSVYEYQQKFSPEKCIFELVWQAAIMEWLTPKSWKNIFHQISCLFVPLDCQGQEKKIIIN